jgi:hypothetical protein
MAYSLPFFLQIDGCRGDVIVSVWTIIISITSCLVDHLLVAKANNNLFYVISLLAVDAAGRTKKGKSDGRCMIFSTL